MYKLYKCPSVLFHDYAVTFHNILRQISSPNNDQKIKLITGFDWFIGRFISPEYDLKHGRKIVWR